MQGLPCCRRHVAIRESGREDARVSGAFDMALEICRDVEVGLLLMSASVSELASLGRPRVCPAQMTRLEASPLLWPAFPLFKSISKAHCTTRNLTSCPCPRSDFSIRPPKRCCLTPTYYLPAVTPAPALGLHHTKLNATPTIVSLLYVSSLAFGRCGTSKESQPLCKNHLQLTALDEEWVGESHTGFVRNRCRPNVQ